MNVGFLSSHRAWFVLTALAALSACGKHAAGGAGDVPPLPAVALAGAPAEPVRYSYQVINSWPHDPAAFTQGLVYRGGDFIESTGLNGESSLRDVEASTGRVLKKVSVPSEYFAEGLAVIGTHAYQLTWQNHKGFIYSVDTFQREGEFAYDGEGWGLATDGQSLVLSDGTDRIRFLDPATFRVTRTIDVTVSGKPLRQLNELEWVNGEIFANVWQTNEIVRIDPSTGAVRGIVDLTDLLPIGERGPRTDVLNGIAYDADTGRLFITGKRWPRIFEVKLVLSVASPSS